MLKFRIRNKSIVWLDLNHIPDEKYSSKRPMCHSVQFESGKHRVAAHHKPGMSPNVTFLPTFSIQERDGLAQKGRLDIHI